MCAFFNIDDIGRRFVQFLWDCIGTIAALQVGISVVITGQMAIYILDVGDYARKVQRFMRVQNLELSSLVYHSSCYGRFLLPSGFEQDRI